MEQLNKILCRNVGISVASLDYLSNIHKKLSEPKIIEETKSKYVADATTKDELTGLYLREVFDVVLAKEIEEANRKKSPLCLLMIDIDDFKNVNDTYGHLEGDKVLEKLGAVINDSVRNMDLAARYGGEEIGVIIPRVNKQEAHKAAERIRQAIENLQFHNFSVTVSIGVALISKYINSPSELIRAADEALYEAKDKGKNQVIIYTNAH